MSRGSDRLNEFGIARIFAELATQRGNINIYRAVEKIVASAGNGIQELIPRQQCVTENYNEHGIEKKLGNAHP